MIMELMLNGGVCRMSGERIALREQKALGKIKTCDEFVSWYKDELVYFIEKAARACRLIDSVYYKAYPAVMLSSTIEGCIENAQDACDCGPKYRFSNINNTGMANVVDSLMAIKETVFEKKMISLTELNEALAADFTGYGDAAAYIRKNCKKFGNGEEEADALMAELVNLAADTINAIPNGRGSHFRSGFYSVEWHAGMGAKTGATPDGRKAGTSLANGFCPAQGADTKGPTAVINAITRCDHTKFANGMVLDLKFNPSFFKNPVHRGLLRPLLDTYFGQGGMELQFNVVSRETLIAARKDPEKYRNLIVRVSGFSAYFVSLYKPLQDEIIARTEYTGAGDA
jgi:formate C-acetyltransferase